MLYNRQNYVLNENEKRVQNTLRILGFIVCLVLIKGMYNDKNGLDQNNFLFPLFAVTAGLFSLLYGINALTTGNLVRRWVNEYIFNALINFAKKRKDFSDEDAIDDTTKLLGKIVLGLSALLFVSLIIFFIHSFLN